MPLVVITRGRPEEQGADGHELEDARQKEHVALALLSNKGKHVIATRSGHHVQIEEPELVVTTIREVIASTRR
jgi:hypothetical protein